VYKASYRVKQIVQQEYRHVYELGGDRDPLPGPGDAGETVA
jgi:hypothetical protein